MTQRRAGWRAHDLTVLDHPLIHHMIVSLERDQAVADARLAAIVRDARGPRISRRARLLRWARRRPVAAPVPRKAPAPITTH
jgi:hypothetical protein